MPFVSLWLIWPRRHELTGYSAPLKWLALIFFLIGVGILAGYWLALRSGWKPLVEDYLSWMTLSFLSFFATGTCLCLGRDALPKIAFPAAMLVFMAPFPVVVRNWIESFFQHGSADAAHILFTLSGMPVFRDGTTFKLPGFSLEVAPQCSGIHSSLVLFITSLIAGHIFLVSRWKRGVLALAVIPLALLRNGVRIVTIGQLCVRISPDMIDSYIHRHGGPIFFALSLIPFFLLLLLLRKTETHSKVERT
jgi:exosortase C (VPDSG-CTERM-specific)